MTRIGVFLLLLITDTAFSQSIPAKTFIDSAMEKQLLSSIDTNKFFAGISLGQIEMTVSFESVEWIPKTQQLVLSGLTRDQLSGEPLANVSVSIGQLHHSDETYQLVPHLSATTDSSGLFTLAGRIHRGDKLLFSGVGFFVKLFDLDWLFSHTK